MVLAVIHRDRCDFWFGTEAQPRKVSSEVGRPFAATELDDSHALPRSGAGRKIIKRRDLQRGVGRGAIRSSVPAHVAVRRSGAVMRSCHGPVVQAKYSVDATHQFFWQVNAPGAPSIRTIGKFKSSQIDTKCRIELCDCAREHHGT